MMTLSEACRRDAENNWTDPLPWCDGDWVPLKDLRECWDIGRELARIIRAYRVDGKPFDKEADLLRDVKKMCSKRLLAWQPTPQQRERAN